MGVVGRSRHSDSLGVEAHDDPAAAFDMAPLMAPDLPVPIGSRANRNLGRVKLTRNA